MKEHEKNTEKTEANVPASFDPKAQVQYPSQLPHSTKQDPQNPANTPLSQIATPVPTVNPKEPPVPSKRDQPAIPLENDLHYQIQTIINDAHRGINPDPAALPADKKAKLIEYLNQESENERVFRDPSRELIRERLRELLGAGKKKEQGK